MFRKLFLSKQVGIIDGDDRLNACTDQQLKTKLKSLLDNGMNTRGVQIFHYAALHYDTRWNHYPQKLLNAFIDCSSSISDGGNYLSLNNSEEPELQKDSSEILGIGLSNMFMCRWFGININQIEKIQGAGKRCDYRFQYKNQIIFFESKGRSSQSKIKSALNDCMKKKTESDADLMYSTICHLPRNGFPVNIYLYDPPIGNNIIDLDMKYVLAKHYSRVSELSGLTILADAIRKRIKQYEETGVWNNSPLSFGNVMKIGVSMIIGNDSFWTRKSLKVHEYKSKNYYVQFGLHEKVIELLGDWNFDELLRFKLEDNVYMDHNLSILSDGSLFYLHNKSID